ncbi:MAG: glycosyltransferase [Fibrobacteria bacterium]|nr:glycosyltransferase [Fibrobacteria bacterium]
MKAPKKRKKKKKMILEQPDNNLPIDLNKAFGKILKPFSLPYLPNTLSVVMIVKNESENIKAAVDSFSGIADEIIINDTGSTDGTQDILDTLNVNWFQTEWQDDFSLARNQSLEKARCSWVLWMDADDRLPSDQIENFKKLKTAPLDRIFGFQVINTQAGRPLGSRFMQLRMFPNHPEIRFTRKIHEQFIHSAARLGVHCMYTETVIHHTGYEDEMKKKQKARRNLELAGNESEKIQSDPVFATCTGDSYYILEQWEKGIQSYKIAYEHPTIRHANNDIYRILPNNIGIGYQKQGQFDEAVSWYNRAIERNPTNLEPVFHKATTLELLKKGQEAEACYLKVIDMPLVHSSTGNQYDSLKIYSFHYLSRMYMSEGRYAETIPLLEKMHQQYDMVIETWEALGDCYLNTGQKENARSAWETCIGLNPAKFVHVYYKLLDVLQALGDKDSFIRLADQGRQQFSDFKTVSFVEKNLTANPNIDNRQPDTSLCMIVKNEEKVLGACLASAASLFDEIIIADTGSRDNTVSIAKSYGAKVVSFPWQDNFSLARNASLEPANGRWIMWLDADDVVPKHEVSRIRELLVGPADKAYGFMIQNSSDGGKSGTVFNQIRLFPNRPDIRFSAPVHEQVLPAIETTGIPVEYTSIKIFHTGYQNQEISRQKQIRNKKILEAQIAEGKPVTAVTYYTLGAACMDLGDHESALEWFMRSVELAEKTGTDPHIIAAGPAKTASVLANLKRYNEALKVLDIGLKQNDVLPETVLVKAQIEEVLGNTQEALKWYTRLLDFTEKPVFLPVDYRLLKIKALEFIGGYWHRKGNNGLAVACLKAGISLQDGGDFTNSDLERLKQKYQ